MRIRTRKTMAQDKLKALQDKLKALAEEAARQALQRRQAKEAKEKRLLDLLSGDSAKDEQSAASYGGDRVLAAIMRDHSELDADEVRKKLDDLF